MISQQPNRRQQTEFAAKEHKAAELGGAATKRISRKRTQGTQRQLLILCDLCVLSRPIKIRAACEQFELLQCKERKNTRQELEES